jgi:preprotein translocase subunit SecG
LAVAVSFLIITVSAFALLSFIREEFAVLFAADLSWATYPLMVILILLSLFMILLVLIQRGKGGGLAGAFGGAGGSSAFGSRAGDTFTRVTVIVAAIWILIVMILIKVVHPPRPDQQAPASFSPDRGNNQPLDDN